MGHGIAQIFAVHGHPVWLVDVNEETLNTAKERVGTNLTNMVNQGVTFGAGVEEILERITTTQNMTTASESSDFVYEAVFEDLELKQRIFTDLDRMCPPKSILCSNTSVISIIEIAEKAKHR